MNILNRFLNHKNNVLSMADFLKIEYIFTCKMQCFKKNIVFFLAISKLKCYFAHRFFRFLQRTGIENFPRNLAFLLPYLFRVFPFAPTNYLQYLMVYICQSVRSERLQIIPCHLLRTVAERRTDIRYIHTYIMGDSCPAMPRHIRS